MPTTVYYATNRVLTGSADVVSSYGNALQPPSISTGLVYGVAFVDGIDIATNTQGVITGIDTTQTGQFPRSAIDDLSQPGRNLLLFVHGFDNSFEDAITRAAFNREWMAASGNPGSDTTVIAFSWPSLGRILDFPFPQTDYLHDQHMASQSGVHLMTLLANLEPILTGARRSGRRSFLLAHSMGNLALQSAVENWFLHGNGQARLFDVAFLAAGDCRADSFDQPSLMGLSGLDVLARKTSILYSHADHVLQLSAWVNGGAARLGQDGPVHRSDAAEFPPAQYTMQDSTDLRDFQSGFLASHQYYRLSPDCRASLASQMAG